MKAVSLKDLKENLSTWVDFVQQGHSIQIMKYNKPIVVIYPTEVSLNLRIGKNITNTKLKPCLTNATQGEWIKFLEEDRNS